MRVLVVGGGSAGTRKAISFHEAGAMVRVISREVSPALAEAGRLGASLLVEKRSYAGREDIGNAELVIAATGDAATDASVSSDARALSRLVNVAGAPESGGFSSMATHRAGAITIGVSAGSVPGAATRIRDAIADRFGHEYAAAVAALSELRARTLEEKGSAEWARVYPSLIGEDFCDRVERGRLKDELTACR